MGHGSDAGLDGLIQQGPSDVLLIMCFPHTHHGSRHV